MIQLLDLTEEQRRTINGFEDDILKLIDGQDAYTRSDLQAIVMVLVITILNAGKPCKAVSTAEQSGRS